jgi:hypothetical protein
LGITASFPCYDKFAAYQLHYEYVGHLRAVLHNVSPFKKWDEENPREMLHQMEEAENEKAYVKQRFMEGVNRNI